MSQFKKKTRLKANSFVIWNVFKQGQTVITMKKITQILLGISLISSLTGFAQKREIDLTNTRDGEAVEYCTQHKKHAQLMSNPAYVQSLQADEIIRQKEANNPQPKGVIYKIPVVFHVLHNNGVENISDEQILDALFILNRDYRLQNADANNVHADFQGMPSDVEIEFVLATKAPNGTCFAGITRTANALTFDGSNGGAQVDAIVAGNDIYNGQWQGNKYLNIFVVAEADGAAGYTMKPSNFVGTVMDNGIWILHNYVGSIGTSSVTASRALTHEVGHWLNLDHTWGGNNNPGNASSCSTDDAVQDTPNCIGVTSCAINSNTCNSDDAYWGQAMRDNVENYMDYSYCSKMFTAGQVTRMRTAITSSTGGRNNLWTTSNLTAVGATGVTYLCKAQFSADITTVCAGSQIQYTDESYNTVTGWNWTFEGGTPATSTSQNPLITYSTPGIYQVSLNATDGTNSDAEIKTQFIRVLPAPATVPYFEGFESYTTFSNILPWEVINSNNNNAFSLESSFGRTGTKCARLTNFGQAGSNEDELISAPIDLSSISSGTGMTLTFRYAYRKRTTADNEYLKVFVSSDCGSSWVQRKTIGGNQLSSLTSSTSWTPSSSADWVTIHMTNITSEYWNENFRYKFKFEGDNGNNIFIDDINLYSGAPSETIILGLDEATEIGALSLYPNPTEGELNLLFDLASNQTVSIQLQDVCGKIVQNHTVNAAIGSNVVLMDTHGIAAGSYFLTIQAGTTQKVMQFVVK
jgi:PKD repeat protein